MFFLVITVDELFLTFMVMLFLVVVLIITVLLYSFFQYKNLSNYSAWCQMIDKKISETIVFGKENDNQDPEFEKMTKNPKFRNVFLEKLVECEKKFSGMAQDEIIDLFYSYNLEKEAFKKLEQTKSHLIGGGIQELTSMKVKSALPKITYFLSHPAPQVYQEAQYAMLAFKGFEGLDFLNNTPHIISEWQQLRLLTSITKTPNQADHNIHSWLESTNNSVIIFTLRLLKKFQMFSFYDSVWNLLQNSSIEVRIKAVQTLLSLENNQTIPDFITIFPEQPTDVQSEIIKTMEISRDQRAVAFLKEQLFYHPMINVRISAAEALFSLGHQNYLSELIDLETSSDELIKIIKHALQERIC